VVTHDAQIAQLCILRSKHEPPDAGPMHFDAEIVAFRMRRGECRQIFAVTKADLDDARRASPEERIEIERLRGVLDAILWRELLERALLRLRAAPGAGDERTNGSRMFGSRHAATITNRPRKKAPQANFFGLIRTRGRPLHSILRECSLKSRGADLRDPRRDCHVALRPSGYSSVL